MVTNYSRVVGMRQRIIWAWYFQVGYWERCGSETTL